MILFKIVKKYTEFYILDVYLHIQILIISLLVCVIKNQRNIF